MDNDVDDTHFLCSVVGIRYYVCMKLTVHSALNDQIFPQLNFKAIRVIDRHKWNKETTNIITYFKDCLLWIEVRNYYGLLEGAQKNYESWEIAEL